MQHQYDYKRYAVLYVDDEEMALKYFEKTFGGEFRIFTAPNALEGLKILEARGDEIGVLMTDQRMPYTTGVQLLESVRVRFPQAVRMLFTGYSDTASIIAAINQGHIFAFLKKPWEPEELDAVVREAAAEYDRIVEQIIENARLRAEVDDLRQRVATLEASARREGE